MPTAQGDTLDQAARLLFESARASFDSGDYATALARFNQAYAASPRPALLFNIATTLDRLRRDEEACATFERYLEASPNVANRTEIEARIRSLRMAIEARDGAHEASGTHEERVAPGPSTEPEQVADPLPQGDGEHSDTGGGTPVALFMASGGATVVVGALAVWAGLSTLSLNDDYEAYAASPGATQPQAKLLFDDASARQLLANVFIVGTAVFGVATIVLALLTDWGGSAGADGPSAPMATTTPILSVDAHGGVVGLVHRF